uniref:Uncharacterized protein n=1 Tax=Oryza punctata TaxID=4537 RepID=A0A0E0L2Y8_ORYPU
MDKKVVMVSAAVGSLGLLRRHPGVLRRGHSTQSPRRPSAAVAAASCKSRAVPSETKWIVGIVCAVVSWFVDVTAGADLTCHRRLAVRYPPVHAEADRVDVQDNGGVARVGAVRGGRGVERQRGEGHGAGVLNYVLKDGIFACAAVLALAATALGIASYVTLRRQPNEAQAPKPGEQPAPAAGIAMGHPAQFSPPASAPPRRRHSKEGTDEH